VNLNEALQRETFIAIAHQVTDVVPPAQRLPDRRYWHDNVAFGMGDALVLAGMFRRLRPRRVIEIGSGHSSAWMLDVDEQWLDRATDFTFIEPYPELLRQLLREDDIRRVRIESRPVQDLDVGAVAALQADDVLFVDSTHVLKIDSDVRHLFARIVPVVQPGVYIHFHDIFWPFEYPESWVREGRAWTEAYLLQAFLQFNREFEIVLWNDWLNCNERSLITQYLPLMATNPGGSIWLRRRAAPEPG
jgi:predicted O-methyltransferase YrrM